MRQRARDGGRHAVSANDGVAFDVENRIGAETIRIIKQATRDLVRIVSEIQRAARGGNSALHNRIADWPIEPQVYRSHDIAKIVAHNQRVASFYAQLVEHGRLRK